MKAIVGLVVLTLAACAGLAPKETETLGESVRAYNDGVRWERFEVAAIHIPVKQRSQFVDESDQRAKDVKITQYDVVRVEQRGDREAYVQIKMEWYKNSEGTVHETHAMQTWERHGKLWLMVDEARLRGVEMPGLPEPVTKQ
jgi:hypothetical protein